MPPEPAQNFVDSPPVDSGPNDQRPRVVHIITGLGLGGAEMMLYKLLAATPDAGNRALVISLSGDGPVGARIRLLGVSVRALRLNKHLPNPMAILRLARWIKEARPDVVQTWMYHADVIGGLAGKLANPRVPIIWNLRASNLDAAVIGAGARVFARLSAWLSGWLPRHIVSCSSAAMDLHVALGYPNARMSVIPNGFDLAQFRPDPEARRQIRVELGATPEEILIGLVARFHPMKDHATFVRAAERLSAEADNVRFVLCGTGVTWGNAELVRWIDAAGLRARFFLLGERSDINRIDAALDVATVASRAVEGFPNVLGEAMACGVPCVATDVGDSAYILGETGRTIAPGDAAALAAAWRYLIDLGPRRRHALGRQAMERIRANFSLPIVAARYEALYRSTATATAR